MECVVVIENLNLSKVEPLVSHWIRENVEKYKDCVVVCPDENGIRKVNSRAGEIPKKIHNTLSK